jgi:hypothetical protein
VGFGLEFGRHFICVFHLSDVDVLQFNKAAPTSTFLYLNILHVQCIWSRLETFTKHVNNGVYTNIVQAYMCVENITLEQPWIYEVSGYTTHHTGSP